MHRLLITKTGSWASVLCSSSEIEKTKIQSMYFNLIGLVSCLHTTASAQNHVLCFPFGGVNLWCFCLLFEAALSIEKPVEG